MMRAARQIRRKTILTSGMARGDRRPDRAPGAFHHFRRPRKANLSLLAGIERTSHHPLDVIGRMNARQLGISCDRRFVQHDTRQFGLNTLAQKVIFLHRKPMAGRQRQHEPIAIKGFHSKQNSTFPDSRSVHGQRLRLPPQAGATYLGM
jgi:hypothetical protein